MVPRVDARAPSRGAPDCSVHLAVRLQQPSGLGKISAKSPFQVAILNGVLTPSSSGAHFSSLQTLEGGVKCEYEIYRSVTSVAQR